MADGDTTSTQVHSRDFKRVLPVLVALERIEHPTTDNVVADIGITEKDLLARLASLKSDYNVLIEKNRHDSSLKIIHWGILDRRFFSHREQ